jgi:hypothetical protein
VRDRFPLLLVGFVALVGVLGWFLLQGARRAGFADELSSFKSEPDGARALYLLVSESGLPVVRHQQDLTIIPKDRNLVLLGTRFLDEEDLGRLAFDGSDGGVAVDPAEEEEFNRRGVNALRSPRINEDEREKLLAHVRDGATLLYVPGNALETKLFDELGVVLEPVDASLGVRTLVPAQPSRYVQGVQRVVTKVKAFLELPPGSVALLVDDTFDKPVAAAVPYGQGRVILVAAPELAMNKNLAVADNARFWHAVVATMGDEAQVAFDEYHHGFTGERSMGEFAARYGLHYAVAQLLLGVMLWALALKRFGRPRPPDEELRVGSTDALFATSRLYREGKHHAHAASSIVKHVASEFASRAGVSGRSTTAEIGAALELRGRKDLANALLDLARTAAATSTEADVERVASLAAIARKTLNHHPRNTR